MTSIVISGYFGFDNFGDEAILEAMIVGIKQANKNVEITILSQKPDFTANKYNVKAVSRNNPAEIFKAIRDCQLFISGGGSLLQDVTGWKSIPYYTGQIFLARMLGKKTVIYAQGIGPVKNKFNSFLIRRAAIKADLVTVRDKGSRDILIDFGLDSRTVKLTADPVFLRANSDYNNDKPVEIEDIPTDKKILGVSIRPWKDSNYLKKLAPALDRLTVESDSRILLIPFHSEQDKDLSLQLSSLLKADSIVLKGQYNISEMLEIFSKIDFLIGVRYHSLVFATLTATPFLALSYDPKVWNFVSSLGINLLLDINQLDNDVLYRIARSIQGNESQVRTVLQQYSRRLSKLAEYNLELLEQIID